MNHLSRRERIGVVTLCVIFPWYPAISVFEMQHGEISIIRVILFCICFTSITLLVFHKAMNLRFYNSFGSIKGYLNSIYDKQELKSILRNYTGFKVFHNPPWVTKEAQLKDSNLREYQESYDSILLRGAIGGILWILSTLSLFYVFIWI